MNDLRVCRTCLSLDVKLVNLNSQPLHNYYQLLLGKSVFWDPIPVTICVKCTAMFTKFSKFREQCINSEGILNALVCSNAKITDKEIEISRSNLRLSINLSTETQQNIDVLCNSEEFDVDAKIEPHIDIKVEADYDDYYPLSSDDEPLSLHRSLKDEQEGKKEKKKKKKSEKSREVPMVTVDSVDDDVEPRKQKRGRPKKSKEESKPKKPVIRRTQNTGGVCNDDMDLETFCTITKLTLEEQIAEVAKRQNSSNYKNALFQCELCYKGFIDDEAWKHHLNKHSPSSGDMECPVCKMRFRTKRTLQKHTSNHEKKYECKACCYVSQTTTQAKQHQRWHKGVTYKCQYCDEVSTKWTSYLSHVRIKHPSEHICPTCGYSFVSRLGLTMHRTMMHKDQDQKETDNTEGTYCEQCDVKFETPQAWRRHMVTSVKHTQSRDLKLVNGCRVCGERFADSEQLRIHHRRSHARARPKNYGKPRNERTWPAKCTYCPEEIPNAREYWTHFRREHPDKNYPIPKDYVCDICGKSFRGNAFLVYHKRTHSNERGFKCPLCPKAFFNRYNLQMHEKTHSENRPHPCSVCFKAFKSKGALDRHFRSHTGEKPYACEVCGKAFAQSNSRKLHVRTVHLKQPSPYLSRSRQERRKCAAAALQLKDAHY
ncbi:zinc finger protein 383-like [Aricia agestis]|uniref:zinc finger protein 383-like n=1 Tax=Aricia agestis TaxID=91739 RepID=UPI001C204CE6|nr:zinc finger protein 383-like [Aricia agestis]